MTRFVRNSKNAHTCLSIGNLEHIFLITLVQRNFICLETDENVHMNYMKAQLKQINFVIRLVHALHNLYADELPIRRKSLVHYLLKR